MSFEILHSSLYQKIYTVLSFEQNGLTIHYLCFWYLCLLFFQNLFQMGTRLWRRCCVHKFKFLLVVLVIALFIGEIGCFCLCFVIWRMPQASSDSLNLLFVSDSQIQVSLSCKEALDMRQKSSFTVFDLNALSY